MAEFTKEQLINLARENVRVLKQAAMQHKVQPVIAMDLRLAEIALAALTAGMEQEPVAWIVHAHGGDQLTTDGGYVANAEGMGGIHSTPLYAAPQLPQPAVMDAGQSKRLFDEWSGGDAALGELRESGVPDEFISMLKDFSLATWEACREAMVKQPVQFIVTSDERMMEMPAPHDIDAVAAMLQGAEPVMLPYKLPDGWVDCSERMPDKLIPVMVMYADGEMWSAIWTGTKWDDGTEFPDPHAVTHWQEMPAAPQQEA